MPRVADWQREHSEALRIVLVSRGDRDANLAHAREHGLSDVLIQRDREVSERYLVNGTPSAVLLAPDGTIASPLHEGADALVALVDRQLGAPTLDIRHHEPTVGRPVPELTLRTLDGEERALSSMLSGPTVVLFWRPSCGFCEQMLPDAEGISRTRAPRMPPSLLLISTDDPETNRAMDLKAPILLDGSFAAGTAFGAARDTLRGARRRRGADRLAGRGRRARRAGADALGRRRPGFVAGASARSAPGTSRS